MTYLLFRFLLALAALLYLVRDQHGFLVGVAVATLAVLVAEPRR